MPEKILMTSNLEIFLTLIPNVYVAKDKKIGEFNFTKIKSFVHESNHVQSPNWESNPSDRRKYLKVISLIRD